ncbi:MAG: ATP-binding protein, partial [Rhodospirillales bacterium]
GIDIENITFITGTNNTEMFVSGQGDAIVGHRFGEQVITNALGKPPRRIDPARFGINFYGDSLFTSRKFAVENPELVARFRAATLEGWQYAMNRPRELIEQIIDNYDRRTPASNETALNLDQAEKVRDLTLYPIVRLGNTNPHRWEAIHDSLLRMNVLKNPLNVEAFIFDPERLAFEAEETRQRVIYWIIGILSLLLVAGTVWTVTLRQSVKRATRDLAAAFQVIEVSNKKLRRSNSDLEEFAYVAAHDLQEPLRKIQAFGQLIQHDQAENLDDRGKEYFGLMTDAASRMQRLIAALLSYSRVATRTEPFRPAPLQEIYDDVMGDLAPAISAASADVTAGPLPEILCDESQFHQLLQNLIGNALKFRHPERSPVITIQHEIVPHSDNLPGPVSVIRISDNGIGIDEKYRKSVFEPFKRLHDREKYPGTGIGLAICQKIVSRHDGHISVGSSPDLGGAEFVIELPVRENQEQTTGTAS